MTMATDTASDAKSAETGSATAKRLSGPDRRCLVTRAVRPKETMIRFVVGLDDVVTPDLAGRLPGRGMWVSARRAALETAIAKRQFTRAARRPVTVPDGLVDQVEAMLVRRCIELLGLARRAGLAVMGFEKVRVALRSGQAALLLAASDGAADGRGKLRTLAPEVPVFDLLDAAQIGGAFGRDHVVHAGVTAGALSERLRGELTRLAGLRGEEAATGNGTKIARKSKTARGRRATRH